MTVVLDGGPLEIDDVVAVARDDAEVRVGAEAAHRVASARRYVEELS